MTYAEYLNTMTVKTLTEIAKRMGIAHSGMRKAEFVQHIAFHIDAEHGEALALVAKYMRRNKELDKVFTNSLHTDSPLVIDTEEFPMDHGQFVKWYNLNGGIDSFDVVKAIKDDHDEALSMNVKPLDARELTYTVPGTEITLTGISAQMMIRHETNIRRYNPTLKRDKSGMVSLTRKQIRRCNKKLRKYGKGIGFFA